MDSKTGSLDFVLQAEEVAADEKKISEPSKPQPKVLPRRRVLPRIGYDSRGFIHINLLATPVQDRRRCELCNNIGRLVCDKCRVTYYCVVEHFLLDKGFHSGICTTVQMLRQPIEFNPIKETRCRLENQRRLHMEELFRYAFKMSQAALEKGDFREAIPSATIASEYAKFLYGQTEPMILPLLIVAECHLGRGCTNMAEGFLARALNIELNESNIRPSIRSKIRHNEGIIAMAREDYHAALASFADQVYYASEEYGPEHRKTAVGYCNLGRLFHHMGKYDASNSLFKQVVSIWTNFLVPIYEKMTIQSSLPKIAGMKFNNAVEIETTDQCEAQDCFKQSYKYQHRCIQMLEPNNVTHIDLANSCYGLSVLYYICNRSEEAHMQASLGIQNLKAHHTLDEKFVKKFTSIFKLSTTINPTTFRPSIYAHVQLSSSGNPMPPQD